MWRHRWGNNAVTALEIGNRQKEAVTDIEQPYPAEI
jgi:hypothetical protein